MIMGIKITIEELQKEPVVYDGVENFVMVVSTEGILHQAYHANFKFMATAVRLLTKRMNKTIDDESGDDVPERSTTPCSNVSSVG
jgi:hypothetical protein